MYQHDSDIYMCIYIFGMCLCYPFLKFFPIIGYYKMLSIVPYGIQ